SRSATPTRKRSPTATPSGCSASDSPLEHRAVDVVELPGLRLFAVRAFDAALGLGQREERVKVHVVARLDGPAAFCAAHFQQRHRSLPFKAMLTACRTSSHVVLPNVHNALCTEQPRGYQMKVIKNLLI